MEKSDHFKPYVSVCVWNWSKLRQPAYLGILSQQVREILKQIPNWDCEIRRSLAAECDDPYMTLTSITWSPSV